MLVGFHVEGHDHLILKALIVKLLGVADSAIASDHLDELMGWHQVLDMLPKALKRFYGKCCAFAVVGVDNDGNEDLAATGGPEDPKHPRHWLHTSPSSLCRHCEIERVITGTRSSLHWLPNKPGGGWPVIVCVPVEMTEAWLLIAQGSQHAERERRSDLKHRVYRRPEPTRGDVESIALPLIRSLSPAQVAMMRRASRSFDSFATQVGAIPTSAVTTPCW